MTHFQEPNFAGRRPTCMTIRRNKPVFAINVTSDVTKVTCERCKRTKAYQNAVNAAKPQE